MNYLEDIYRLAYVKRYSNVPKLHEESVAEHGFFVAAIVVKLYEEYEFDLGQALLIAVSHDMTEMELNDCPHIIKEKYPAIAKAYQVCEEEVANTLPPMIAWGAREFDQVDKSKEASVVHLADAMQCIQFSEVELKLGNSGYMQIVYSKSKERVRILKEGLEKYERRRKEG